MPRMKSFLEFSLFLFLISVSLNGIEGIDDISKKSSSKPSDFKIKLAKTEFAEAVKNAKPEPLASFDDYENVSISDLGITVPPEHINDTVLEAHHTYYNSSFYANSNEAMKFWVDFNKLPPEKVVVHDTLSASYRQAMTVELSFDFPFYGSPLRNITIATGGFIYLGDYLHNWIAATQYIAPLMANIDTSVSPESFIKYTDNGTSFTVEWHKVHIQNRKNDGNFTFQATLQKNGDIIFVYQQIPYPISNISDAQHPVKVGISDAYIIERTVFFIRRKTIYEYHRIDMLKQTISNQTALYLKALPTCLDYKDCFSCLAVDASLECGWCEAVQRCSDGIDRQRQNWVHNECSVRKEKTCPSNVTEKSTVILTQPTVSSKSTDSVTKHSKSTPKQGSTVVRQDDSDIYARNAANAQQVPSQEVSPFVQNEESKLTNGISPGAIVTIVIFLLAIISAGVWVTYAYRYPQTTSGQFLIKYRPTQWNFKKGESSTCDTLHI